MINQMTDEEIWCFVVDKATEFCSVNLNLLKKRIRSGLPIETVRILFRQKYSEGMLILGCEEDPVEGDLPWGIKTIPKKEVSSSWEYHRFNTGIVEETASHYVYHWWINEHTWWKIIPSPQIDIPYLSPVFLMTKTGVSHYASSLSDLLIGDVSPDDLWLIDLL